MDNELIDNLSEADHDHAINAAVSWYWHSGAISRNIPRGCVDEYLAYIRKAGYVITKGRPRKSFWNTLFRGQS